MNYSLFNLSALFLLVALLPFGQARGQTPPPPVLGSPSSGTPSLPPVAAPSNNQTSNSPQDLCALLPAGPLKQVGSTVIDPITEVDGGDRSAGILGKCIKAYSEPPDLTLGVYQYDRVDQAERYNSNKSHSSNSGMLRSENSTAYGEVAIEYWEQDKSEGQSRYYELFFRRGCYVFSASDRMMFGYTIPSSWEPVPAGTIILIRSTAAQVDGQLKTLPSCTEATITPPVVRVRTPTPVSPGNSSSSGGAWIPWVLVPGVGWVIYTLASRARDRKKKEDGADHLEPQHRPPPLRPPDKKKAEERKEYELDIRTQDDRTSLTADGEDILWIYAQVRCNKPEVNTAALTAGLIFSAEGTDAQWLNLGPSQQSSGFKTVPIRAWPPSQNSQLVEGKVTVKVSAVLEGSKLDVPVKLDLEPKYVMEFV